MNIYQHTCNDRTPYTYLIGWSQHNKWYYGVRFAKNCKPDDLWRTYFTSSKYVNVFRKEWAEPDIIEIRKTFSSVNEAIEYEHKVLRRLSVITDGKWLNKSVSDGKFLCVGHTEETKIKKRGICTYKNKQGDFVRTTVDDPQVLNGELIGTSVGFKHNKEFCQTQRQNKLGMYTYININTKEKVRCKTDDDRVIQGILVSSSKGRIFSKEHRENLSQSQKGKPKSTEHCSILSINKKGKTHYKDLKTNKLYYLFTTDPLIKELGLVGRNKGNKLSSEQKQLKFECNICNRKFFNKGNYSRHYNACKLKCD